MSNWLTRIVASALATAIPAAAATADTPNGVILEYHHVSEDTPPSTSVTPETFEAHLELLEESGFRVLPLPELVERVRDGEDVGDKAVALTFDDAYRSVYTEVFPMLKERDWPFTVFVSTDYLDRDYGRYMDWDMLREMSRNGATIANHSVSHPHLVRRKKGEDESAWKRRIRSEIVDAQERLEDEVGEVPRLFAYPYGEYSPPVQAVVREEGYVGLGQHSGAFGPDSDFTTLPRFPFAGPASIDTFAVKVRSRAMPLERVEPASGVVGPKDDRPELRLEFDDDDLAASVNCYIGGEPASMERHESPPAVTVRPRNDIGAGRTKYNCTAPARGSNAWYWYSFVWMKPEADGRWYTE